MRKLLILVLLCAPLAHAANAVFVSQSGAGSTAGTSCANAKALTYFNTAGNWSGSPTGIQIGPDTTVTLCGTITQEIFISGSGTSGHPIIFQFDPTSSGTISVPTETDTQLIFLGGFNFLTFIGHSSEGVSPDCQATANGTSPGFANQNTFSCFNGNNSHDITISNFGCANLYQHTSVSDTTQNSDVQACYYANPMGANITIHDSTFHDTGDGVLSAANSGTLNFQFYNNNVYNTNHLVDIACAASTTNVFVHDNQMHDAANWDTTANAYHHDGFFMQGGASGTCSSWYDYNNWYYGNWGANVTSPIFVDSNGNTFTGITIFNDVFQNTNTSNGWTNGVNLIGQGTIFAYNNTIICGPSTSQNLGLQMSDTVDDRNNVQSSCQQFFSTSNGVGTSITAMDFNAYANLISSGSPAFSFGGSGSGSGSLATQFTAWKTVVQGKTAGSEAHSITAASAGLNSNGSPASGSFVIGAGTNLTSLCSGTLAALCSDTTLGNTRTATARPTIAPWDIGAFEFVNPTASTPTFSPVAGSYSGTRSVTITASTGGVICYNTTGSPATNQTTGCQAGSTQYTTPVSVPSSETLFAVAGGTGFVDSAVGSAAYTITTGAANAKIGGGAILGGGTKIQ